MRLHLMRWTSRLVCAVRDPSDDSPVARESDDDFSRGVGPRPVPGRLVRDSWGWHPLAGTLSGKVVWALFRLCSRRATAAGHR